MTAQELWEEYLASGASDCSEVDCSAAGEITYEAWSYGCLPDELLELTMRGIKTATASGYPLYEIEGSKVPKAGDYSVILNSRGEARCIIKDTKVEIVPFRDVSAEHAYKEGEDDRSLGYWRKVHRAIYVDELGEAGLEFTEDMPVVCEEFKVVYALCGGALE